MPRAAARFNRLVLNHVMRRVAPWAPFLGVVHHVGRRSGRTYETPVNVFTSQGNYVLALTYGASTDWVRNVVAAGGCDLHTHRRVVHLVAPRIEHDEKRGAVGAVARPILGLLKVSDFMVLDERRS